MEAQRQGVHLANIDDDCRCEVKARVTDCSKEEPGGILEKPFYPMNSRLLLPSETRGSVGQPGSSSGESGGLNLRAC